MEKFVLSVIALFLLGATVAGISLLIALILKVLPL